MKSERIWNSGILLPVTLYLILIAIFSCRHDSNEIDALEQVCFEADILPIFQTSCAIPGCHDGSGESYVFNSYENIRKAVIPGKPDKSTAYQSLIKIWSSEGMMPPDQPLSEYNRTMIRVWILQGARNTTCPPPPIPFDSSSYSNPRACFQRDILPVLLSNCAMQNCHDAITAKEGFKFIDYSNTLKAVVKSNPSGSKLYKVITITDPNDRMPPPPYNSLSKSQIDSIRAWISYGAPDEFCGNACDTVSAMSFSTHIWPIIEHSCKGCHSGTSPSGGISLTTYNEVNTIAASGKLVGVTMRKTGYKPMPPSSPLPGCKMRQIELWVLANHLNN